MKNWKIRRIRKIRKIWNRFKKTKKNQKLEKNEKNEKMEKNIENQKKRRKIVAQPTALQNSSLQTSIHGDKKNKNGRKVPQTLDDWRWLHTNQNGDSLWQAVRASHHWAVKQVRQKSQQNNQNHHTRLLQWKSSQSMFGAR